MGTTLHFSWSFFFFDIAQIMSWPSHVYIVTLLKFISFFFIVWFWFLFSLCPICFLSQFNSSYMSLLFATLSLPPNLLSFFFASVICWNCSNFCMLFGKEWVWTRLFTKPTWHWLSATCIVFHVTFLKYRAVLVLHVRHEVFSCSISSRSLCL